MKIEMLTNVFFWCTVIDYGVLLLWCLMFKLGHDLHYRLTSWWFPVTVSRYDELNFTGIVFFKLAIVLFNLVPFIGLRLAS
jgi:hypothetical protein